MIRPWLPVFVMLLTLGTVSAQEPLAGVWRPVSLRFEQKDVMPAKLLQGVRGVCENGQFRLSLEEKGRPVERMVRTMRLDPTATPPRFSFANSQGEIVLHGIYELEGDTLRLCYGPAAGSCPQTFDAPTGSKRFLEMWKRQPPVPQATAASIPR